jgi:hypothetical protein
MSDFLGRLVARAQATTAGRPGSLQPLVAPRFAPGPVAETAASGGAWEAEELIEPAEQGTNAGARPDARAVPGTPSAPSPKRGPSAESLAGEARGLTAGGAPAEAAERAEPAAVHDDAAAVDRQAPADVPAFAAKAGPAPGGMARALLGFPEQAEEKTGEAVDGAAPPLARPGVSPASPGAEPPRAAHRTAVSSAGRESLAAPLAHQTPTAAAREGTPAGEARPEPRASAASGRSAAPPPPPAPAAAAAPTRAAPVRGIRALLDEIAEFNANAAAAAALDDDAGALGDQSGTLPEGGSRPDGSVLEPAAEAPPEIVRTPRGGRTHRVAEPRAATRGDVTPRGGENEAPVHVTIGRVELRAPAAPPVPASRPAPPGPRLSLDDYLRQRAGRG